MISQDGRDSSFTRTRPALQVKETLMGVVLVAVHNNDRTQGSTSSKTTPQRDYGTHGFSMRTALLSVQCQQFCRPGHFQVDELDTELDAVPL